jgi:hypothetical protein
MAAVVNLATSTVQVRQPWWPFVTWGLVGLLVVIAVRVEVGTRRSQAAEAGELDRVLSWLAVQVREQWEHDAVLRHLYDPMPLRVRWCSTRRPVAADRVLVLDDPAGIDWESLPLRGHAEEIVQAFLKLPHERLVVLGEPGAGKSVLAALLTLGLLRLREALEPEERKWTPLPVLVPISSWNPQAEHLQAFLARRLGEDYPPLSLPGDGESVAAALIAGRRVLPILDGLDELSTELHPRAVSELNAAAGRRARARRCADAAGLLAPGGGARPRPHRCPGSSADGAPVHTAELADRAEGAGRGAEQRGRRGGAAGPAARLRAASLAG